MCGEEEHVHRAPGGLCLAAWRHNKEAGVAGVQGRARSEVGRGRAKSGQAVWVKEGRVLLLAVTRPLTHCAGNRAPGEEAGRTARGSCSEWSR